MRRLLAGRSRRNRLTPHRLTFELSDHVRPARVNEGAMTDDVFLANTPRGYARSADLQHQFDDAAAKLLALDGWSDGSAPPRLVADLALEEELARTRWFRYERMGSEARTLELAPGNRVGAGVRTRRNTAGARPEGADIPANARVSCSSTSRSSSSSDTICLLHHTSELLPRPMEMGFHGAHRERQHPRHFFVRPFFHIIQHDHLAIVLRQ